MLRIIQRIVVLFFIVSVILFAAAGWKTARVRDKDGPEVKMDADSITISIDGSYEDILAGVTASDRKDGDVTDTLVVQGLSNFIEKGRRQATIAAFDSDNNVTKITREVIYSDYVSPHFSLEAPLRFTENQLADIETVMTAADCLDGDITSNITISSEDGYMPYETGDWPITFKAVNSAGDVAELTVTMEIYDSADDNNCPKVILSDYLVYLKSGDSIKPWDYVEGVVRGGMTYSLDDLDEEDAVYSRSDIKISNPVDTHTPGIYEIVYSMDGEDVYQSKIRLIVIVE